MRDRFEKVLRQVAGSHRREARAASPAGAPRLEDLIRKREALGDRIVLGLGLILATGSIAFATYALRLAPSAAPVPEIARSAKGVAVLTGKTTQRADRPMQDDPETTGSIRSAEGSEETARPQAGHGRKGGRDYVLKEVVQGTAFVEGPDGLLKVVPGTLLPGAGWVISIRQAGPDWLVVTSETIIKAAPRLGSAGRPAPNA